MKKFSIIFGVIALLILGYFILDSILFDGIKAEPIDDYGFKANHFKKENSASAPAIILLGGGQWGDYWGQEFAKNGFIGLSLPYMGREGLPKLPEEIDLEYIENAINWLQEQPEVNATKIAVMGASRNAELALLIASTFPQMISGVIAYAPSSVAWSNTVLPYNSDEVKPSWMYKGVAIPYVPMEKISANETGEIKMLEYWKKGLSKMEEVSRAAIKVEQINGPILLFSGKDDRVWPSAEMADSIEKRLNEHNFKYSIQNIQYDSVGHSISGNPEDKSRVERRTIKIDGKDYQYTTGGNADSEFKAKQDAKNKVFAFLNKL
ncbi:hypothetical protein GCM10009117_12940 [Gangjinia marincola]|uniref:BAAT/Acyl-CoA thioester hydrolase C-terminal domain-containing protein n=1 Tax=Gangjinia marincola TaxID=578463 RepID=A0ABP3XX37_9FLAO